MPETPSKTPARKKKRSAPPHGPKTLKGSAPARRTAVVILEVLGGMRTPTQASEALELSLSRYYVLETRALQGMIDALEPRPRGRQRRPEDEIASLERDKRRLEQELARVHALVRAAERSVGLPAAPSVKARKKQATPGKKAKRTRKAQVRAVKAIEALRAQDEDAEAPEAPGVDFQPRS